MNSRNHAKVRGDWDADFSAVQNRRLRHHAWFPAFRLFILACLEDVRGQPSKPTSGARREYEGMNLWQKMLMQTGDNKSRYKITRSSADMHDKSRSSQDRTEVWKCIPKQQFRLRLLPQA